MTLPRTHDLRWPDGRRIVTDRIFPHDIERKNAPDWIWSLEDFDLGDPTGSYFVTEADALADARRAIGEAIREEADECSHPPSTRVTYGRDAAAPLGRETDTVWCDECGEEVRP